jgi:hypothetical protein
LKILGRTSGLISSLSPSPSLPTPGKTYGNQVTIVNIVPNLKSLRWPPVTTAQQAKPTEPADLVRRAFDIDAIAARFRAFLARWDTRNPLPCPGRPGAPTGPAHRLAPTGPPGPAPTGRKHLDADWPAIRAEALFRRLANHYGPTAARIAEGTIAEIRTPELGGAGSDR